jgi:hypothetical protein
MPFLLSRQCYATCPTHLILLDFVQSPSVSDTTRFHSDVLVQLLTHNYIVRSVRTRSLVPIDQTIQCHNS